MPASYLCTSLHSRSDSSCQICYKGVEWQRGSRGCPDPSGEPSKAEDNMSLKPWLRSRLIPPPRLCFECGCDEVKVGSKHSAAEVAEQAFVSPCTPMRTGREIRVRQLAGVFSGLYQCAPWSMIYWVWCTHNNNRPKTIFTSDLLQIRFFAALCRSTAMIFIISPHHQFHLHIPAAVTLNSLLME